ncbi:MAG: hypothetical protein LBK82_11220 [Planctomycetaceae bacterium]|jgi:hypothetical protein|nr:hypothetical protein [Planctomycetaceae bacterium]
MNSEKILRLSSALSEMTSQKQIKWKLDYKRISPFSDNNQTPNVQPFTPNRTTGEMVASRPWIEYVFSSLVNGKIFRLIGEFDFIEEEIKSVKLQLWNKEKDIQEYEFPEHPSFKELFQLVREIEVRKNKFYVAPEVENFVDNLLEESHDFAQNR